MPKTPAAADTDITVTTATRTEDEVRTSLGVEKPAAAPPAAKPAAPSAAQAASLTPEQEADTDTPDPDVSDAARTLRQNRLSEKRKRLTGDNTLYEETIRNLGGTVPALDPREYKNAQEEIDHLTRRRHDLIALVNKSAQGRRTAPPPVAPAVPPAAPAAPVAPKAAEPPKFEFPSWEHYQAQHPDADYTEFLDARSDARETFKEQLRTDAARKSDTEQAEAAALREYDAGEETLRAAHADYDQITNAVDLSVLGTQRIAALKEAILREGKNGPALLYFVAQPANREYVTRLARTQNLGELFAVVGEIRYAAKATAPPAAPAAPAAPGAAAPVAPGAAPAAATAKPKTEAPAPPSDVPGSSRSRSLRQIAEDGEDADEYIATRRAATRRDRTG